MQLADFRTLPTRLVEADPRVRALLDYRWGDDGVACMGVH
jgi:hypothetical protein